MKKIILLTLILFSPQLWAEESPINALPEGQWVEINGQLFMQKDGQLYTWVPKPINPPYAYRQPPQPRQVIYYQPQRHPLVDIATIAGAAYLYHEYRDDRRYHHHRRYRSYDYHRRW